MTNGNDFAFASKEHASLDAPQLIVTYTLSPSAAIAAQAITLTKDEIKNEIQVSPNPFRNRINLTNLTQNSTVKIFNLRGNLVEQQKIAYDFGNIDTYNLQSGYYILKVYNDQDVEILSLKIVKE